MKKGVRLESVLHSAAALFIAIVIAGCASAPEPAESAETQEETPAEFTESPEVGENVDSSVADTEPASDAPMNQRFPSPVIRTDGTAFSQELQPLQRYFLSGADDQPIDSWAASFSGPSGVEVLNTSGDGVPPSEFAWDGMIDGRMAPEGAYTGVLALTYEDGSERTVNAPRVIVDRTSPTPSFSFGGVPFTPDGDGRNDELVVTMGADEAASIVEWEFEIRTPDGRSLAVFNDESALPRTARWNGRSPSRIALESGIEYVVVGWAVDHAGNRGEKEATFLTGAILEPRGTRYRIQLPTILFQPESSNVDSGARATVEVNRDVINRVARIMAQEEDATLVVEGHANSEDYADAARAEIEQTEELLPLSRARAEAIRTALIRAGVPADRVRVEAVGGADPAVPFGQAGTDRNRRVEFYLER